MTKPEQQDLARKIKELVENAPFVLVVLDDPRTSPEQTCSLLTNCEPHIARNVLQQMASLIITDHGKSY